MQVSELVGVSLCAQGFFFDPLGAVVVLSALCAPVGSTRAQELCACAWGGAGALGCAEVFNAAWAIVPPQCCKVKSLALLLGCSAVKPLQASLAWF